LCCRRPWRTDIARTGSHGPAAALREELERLPVVDSHSHLVQESARLRVIPTVFDLLGHHYPLADLKVAGMSDEEAQTVFASPGSVEEKWGILSRYLPYVRRTGFVQCIFIAFSGLFGIEELDLRSIHRLDRAIRAHSRPGYYRRLLRDTMRVRRCVAQMDDLEEVDRELFAPMPRLNRFSMIRGRGELLALGQRHGVELGQLRDLESLIERTCSSWREQAVAGVKLSHSYFRKMDFHPRERADAEKAFRELLADQADCGQQRLLEDYLVFFCCRAAAEQDFTIQFHVGMRAETRQSMEGCSAAPMTELFRALPQARFDLSHSGFPYLAESGVLAKSWPNVYLNMDWIQAISPEASRQALKEWLQMVPFNKIIAFGDDVAHVETAYGALVQAKDNVAAVLAALIEEGRLRESEAPEVARALFFDNPARLYGVER